MFLQLPLATTNAAEGLTPVDARSTGPDLSPIAQSVNVAERLRKARIRFVTTNYDVANAHPSPSHASLSEALVDTLQEDTGLLRQTPRAYHDGNPGSDESILIRPGSGTAQDSEGSADAFHREYHKRIDKWSDHLRAECNSPVFMGLTTYADDVACHLDHHGAGTHIVKSDGEQCCPGQSAG